MKKIARKLNEMAIHRYMNHSAPSLDIATECGANRDDAGNWTFPNSPTHQSCFDFYTAIKDPRIGELRHFMFKAACRDAKIGHTPVLCVRLTRKGYLRTSVHFVGECPHCSYWDDLDTALKEHKPLPSMVAPG